MVGMRANAMLFWGGAIGVAFVLFFALYAFMWRGEPEPQQPAMKTETHVVGDEGSPRAPEVETPMHNDDNPLHNEREEKVKRAAMRREKNLVDLQALLDDGGRQEEALKLALEMVDKDYEQKLAAIDALNWIGGHEAKMGLVKMLQVGGNVSFNSIQALHHLFLEDAQNDEKPFDAEAFFAAVELLGETSRDALLVILCGYPVEQAAPVLIKLMDSPNEDIRRQAYDSFEMVAEGTEVASKAQAEAWLRDYNSQKKDQQE